MSTNDAVVSFSPLVLVLQNPTTTASATFLKRGNDLERLLEISSRLWRGAVSIEVINKHLRIDTSTMG